MRNIMQRKMLFYKISRSWVQLERMWLYGVWEAIMFTHRKSTTANHSRTQNGALGESEDDWSPAGMKNPLRQQIQYARIKKNTIDPNRKSLASRLAKPAAEVMLSDEDRKIKRYVTMTGTETQNSINLITSSPVKTRTLASPETRVLKSTSASCCPRGTKFSTCPLTKSMQ